MKGIILFISTFIFIGSMGSLLPGKDIDLVALKKKEEERRKKLEKSNKKVITVTNENMDQIKTKDKTYSFIQMEGEAEKEEDKDKDKTAVQPTAEDPQKSRDYWQDLKKRIDDEITRLTDQVSQDESRLNRLRGEYLRMGLPVQRQQLRQEIETLSQTLAENKAKLEAMRNELEALVERARKAGVPPGWVR